MSTFLITFIFFIFLGCLIGGIISIVFIILAWKNYWESMQNYYAFKLLEEDTDEGSLTGNGEK